MCVLYFKGRSRSGDRSYTKKVAIRRSFLHEEGRDQEIAPTRRRSRSGDRSYTKKVAIRRSLLHEEGRDQEIAPTGEVLGERGRHQKRSPLGEEVAIGRSLLQHFQTMRSALGEGKVAIGRSLLQHFQTITN